MEQSRHPTNQQYVPSKTVQTQYPLIDNDPHFRRVVGYARTSDYIQGVVAAAAGPAGLLAMEKVSPSLVDKRSFAQGMRLIGFIGLAGGFLHFYSRSTMRFYGMAENAREVEMDMQEMVGKVKAGQSLYGESRLTPAMQGTAARNSRYSGMFLAIVPWFNFVNHGHHGVDTAKYYQQAERELEAERTSKA